MNAEEAALAQVGQTIADKYRLLSLLGAGGMGAVYEAEHVFTKRRVAVKRMHHGIAKSKLAAERFVRESQAPSSIGHPGIVQVLDGGFEADGSLYLVLELLEGVSLREALDEEALDPPNVVQVGIELLEGLAAAHDKGFIHRDIKPDNIFLANDGRGGVTVKLLDFGIASVRDTEGDVKLTQTGAVLGTPLYMSPEQAKGLRIDARSDLWAVGALLYRALSGASPFNGESYNALIVSIVTQDHIPLAERRDDLPDALVAVVEGALHKDASDRFQSANEMLAALREVSFSDDDQAKAGLRPMQSQRPPKVPKSSALPTIQAPVTTSAARAPRPVYTAPAQDESSSFLTKAMLVFGVCALALTLFLILRPKHAPSPAFVPEAAPSAPAPATAAAPTTTPAAAAAAGAAAAPPPSAAPGLAPEAVTAVLSAQQPQMQACLQEAVVAQMMAGAAKPTPLRLDIELHIASSGRVAQVQATGEVPAELQRCVRTRLERAVFPSAPGPTLFSYPLVFQSTIVGN